MAYKGRELTYNEWRRRRDENRIKAAARTVPMGDEEHIKRLAAAVRGVTPNRRVKWK